MPIQGLTFARAPFNLHAVYRSCIISKRRSYSNGFNKLKVVELAIKNGNRRAAGEYGVQKKPVRNWRKKKLSWTRPVAMVCYCKCALFKVQLILQ